MKKTFVISAVIFLVLLIVGGIIINAPHYYNRFIKVDLDVDYVKYTRDSWDVDGYIVLKDGRQFPCKNMFKYISTGYLTSCRPEDTLCNEYRLTPKGISLYMEMDYHPSRIREVLCYTDCIRDPNTYYEPFVTLNNLKIDHDLWLLLKTRNGFLLPFWKKARKIDSLFIQFSLPRQYYENESFFAYKSDIKDGVILLYNKKALFPNRLKQYPSLIIGDSSSILEWTEDENIYILSGLNIKDYNYGFIHWKDSTYLEAFLRKEIDLNTIPALLENLDSVIIESNSLLSGRW